MVPLVFLGGGTSGKSMAPRVTPHKSRGPSLIRGLNDSGTMMITTGREDGWQVEFETSLPHPMTVFQTIVRKIEWGPDEPRQRSPGWERFPEARHSRSSRSSIAGRFVVARHLRVGAEGRLILHARAWVVAGHVALAAMGFTEGAVGDEPWAGTFGKQGTIPIPAGPRSWTGVFSQSGTTRAFKTPKNRARTATRGRT